MFKKVSCVALMFCLLMAANGYADTAIINVYDANGNLVTGDGRYYEYNDANQLSKVRQGDQNGPVIAEYFYDSSGQRVKKIENGVVTYYVGKHFEKQVGGVNAGNTSYYFGEGAERAAKKDPSGKIFYYHLDHLDGINVVTDSAGTEVARADYLPFGELRTGSSDSEKYSYTGKEKDKTDLYYFDARYNSPQFRHFTQPDTAEPDYSDPQDLNRYAYVGNNPMSYVDYDGFKKSKKHHSKAEEKILAKERAAANAKKKEQEKEKEKARAAANAQKKANKKAEEKQRAATDYAKHHPASTVQVGAGYSLAVGSPPASASSTTSRGDVSFGSSMIMGRESPSKMTLDQILNNKEFITPEFTTISNLSELAVGALLGKLSSTVAELGYGKALSGLLGVSGVVIDVVKGIEKYNEIRKEQTCGDLVILGAGPGKCSFFNEKQEDQLENYGGGGW